MKQDFWKKSVVELIPVEAIAKHRELKPNKNEAFALKKQQL